ncbi:hypothetical protein XA68_17229 [Ophiocordyceps unilateralis]|uniref:Cytochrome P450 n=1 Tax=Ophiocordyceps unilateralis TaxID=268505 RepID=A0A2A9P3J8_OPHUN|nr:hypothetical protein XA68_17229 [Ophiocordyceps unilateralis]
MLLDSYPPLQYLPDALFPVKRQAYSIQKSQRTLIVKNWLAFRGKMTDGTASAQLKQSFSDDLASYTCSSLLIAASETTSQQLLQLVKAMVLYPEVQRTARTEIDRVCGDRMPDEADQENMPYIHAMIKEACRLMPTLSSVFPHCTVRDDEYEGYKIPKDTLVIMNIRSLHNDPEHYRDPGTFDPTRYLHDRKSARQSALSVDVSERDHFLFGAGRRLCSGIDIAEKSMFLSMARILWAFDISEPVDAEGNAMTFDPEDMEEGVFHASVKFPAEFTPRSQDREQAVKEEWKATKAALLNEEGQWKELPKDLPFEPLQSTC